MKIGLVTPWPPQKTGIADYAFDLAEGLAAAGQKVTVFTDARNPVPGKGITLEPVDRLNKEVAADFDRIVYQMGNNSDFHLHMIPLLAEIPGVVHLHDMVLHHLMAFVLYARGDHRLYQRALAKWYGPDVTRLFNELLAQGICPWETPRITDVPFFEEVLCRAPSCIVHSHFAQQKVLSAFPDLQVEVIPQVYPALPREGDRQPGPFRIGIFGGVDPQKRADIVIKAAAKAIHAGAALEIHIVGSMNPKCAWILDLAEEMGIDKHIFNHGRASQSVFAEKLAQMDMLVSLRHPTMGETSAVVMRAIQAGIPVAVSDVGWYAELPSFIPKIDPFSQQEVEALAEGLTSWAQMGEAYQKLAAETRAYAESKLDFGHTIKAYIRLLDMACVTPREAAA